MQPTVSVVLSGGAGTRLWPVSRESHPKPFIKLPDGETLIKKTYARVGSLGASILTVTNRDYYFMSKDEMNSEGLSGGFILEPVSRNTAPAIALAAKMVESLHGSEAIMLVLPADHLITDEKEFSTSVKKAVMLASQNYLVALGVKPLRPEIGFGYIEVGSEIQLLGNRVTRFIEKPDLEAAKNYISSNKYLWNCGIFCFKVGEFLAELVKYSPEVAIPINACWSGIQCKSESEVVEIPKNYFDGVPDISIDYALLEKSDRVAVVPANFCWNDIGSWAAMRDLVEPDLNSNRSTGKGIFIDSRNTFIYSEERAVLALGVEDLMIIDTSDALLVSHINKSQDVGKAAKQLNKYECQLLKLHKTVLRPWGSYTVLEQSLGFKIKRIEVKPGASLSLQMHNHRSEHWVVVDGVAKITNGDVEIFIEANQSAYIPAGQKHRLENPGVIPV